MSEQDQLQLMCCAVPRMVATSGLYNHGHPLSVAMLLSRWENRIGGMWVSAGVQE